MRLLAAVILALTFATTARAEPFVLGYNQGWIEGKFGRDLSADFDEADWRKVIHLTKESGGSVLRVWLFEGQPFEGVVYSESDRHEPAGVDPAFLEHVRRVCAIAQEEGVRLYWTGFDGNFFGMPSGLEFDRRWNVLNDKYGFGSMFRDRVLLPVLQAIMERPDAVYAFDIMNEIEGTLHLNFWPEAWGGARRFMEDWARFVHVCVPGLRVTVSAGWGSSASDILDGHFDGVGLDFLDVHQYSDKASIEKGAQLVAHARAHGLPIVIGELGQKKEAVDPALQAKIVRGAILQAKQLGFSGVFVWRLIDEQEHDKRFSFYDGDTPRPAVAVMKALAPVVAPAATKGFTQALSAK